jgi:hypothetical protein
MRVGRIYQFVSLAVFAAFGFAIAGEACAIEIVKVEEHWELRVGEPDGNLSAPQVTMTMSPTSEMDHRYFVFTLNHRTSPQYAAGGLQVQSWLGGNLGITRSGEQTGTLHNNDEVIRWTQKLYFYDGDLVFKVSNGESQSWGTFGGYSLRLQTPTELTNLNDYRPGLSIEESGVGYAGNRVQSLVLTRLVWTDSEGQVYELTAPIDVDTDLDP